MPINQPSNEKTEALDKQDPLAAAKDMFYLPKGLIYLDGNSLGPAPKSVFADIDETARKEWAQDLISSWNTAGWFELPSKAGAVIADIIGAEHDEVVACDTTSINIFKAVHAGLSLRPERSTIVAEAGSFPTDLYMIEGVANTAQSKNVRLEGVDGATIEELINKDTAVVLVNQVDYRTGKIRDVGALTRIAHENGAIIIFDLCHSAGNMPVDVNLNNVDLAVGCTYKYLNGGPGSPAFIYCASKHLKDIQQPLSGWWGHSAPFAFDQSYSPDPGIRKFLCGTQPILSFRAMQAGLELTRQFDIKDIRTKSMALTSLFLEEVMKFSDEFGVGVASPMIAEERGSQVSLTHENGYAIIQALIERGVVGDFRTPNIMRFGFAPLYISYQDVIDAVEILKDVLTTESWRDPKFIKKSAVT